MNSVAIIGGGITGLTAAFRLRERGVAVTLYEAADRVGGVIQSVRCDGYLAECGPNSLLETSPKIGALIRDVRLSDHFLYSDHRAEKRFIVRRGKPVEVPASPVGFLRTPLFSWRAKLHLLKEPFVAAADATLEESVEEFVRRRLGQEFLDYAINPLIAGVYAGDPARLSVTHAFPKLHALEQRYSSLIRGQFLGARERKRRGEVSKQSARKISFVDGLQTLPDALLRRLGNAVQLSSRVTCLDQVGRGWLVTVRKETGVEQARHNAVIFAGPAHKLPEIQLRETSHLRLASLAQIPHPPVATVVLGFRRGDVGHPLDGFGMLIPEVERCHILGTIFSSSLFPNRAPAGHVTLTSYVGGTRAPELALRDPEELIDLTMKDLRQLLGVRAAPTFWHTCIFPKAIPQYEVGFGRFKELMNQIETQAPGLFLAGSYRDGISLSDSILSGDRAAGKVHEFLLSSPINNSFESPPTLITA